MIEIISHSKTQYLHIDGFIYYKHSLGKQGVTYWRCNRKEECDARVVTLSSNSTLLLKIGNLKKK